MYMSATPRSARLSKRGEVVAILVASAAVWVVLIVALGILFFAVFIPAVEFGGRAEIPSDLPVYPGARLQSAFATGLGNCTTVDATWSSSDSAATVSAFYHEALSTGHWTITGSTQENGTYLIDFRSTSEPLRGGYLSVESFAFSNPTQITMALEKSGAQDGSACRLPATP